MKVKVFSTQMGEREVETQATTWEGLQKDLRNEGINYNKMKAVIGENKLTLEAGGAQLPAQGFTLFLMNKKTKAGADIQTMSYKELRGAIKDILAKDESAKAHFNEGKNYTTKGTEVLRNLLASFSGVVLEPVQEKAKKKKTSKPKKSKVKKVKGEKIEPKRGFGATISENDTIAKAQKAVDTPTPTEEKIVEEAPKEDNEVLKRSEAPNVADVVESVKEPKEVETKEQKDKVESTEVGHPGLDGLQYAINSLALVDLSDLDSLLNEDVESLAVRLEGRYIEAKKIYDRKAKEEAEAKTKAEAEAKAKAEAEAKAEEERLAQEAEAEKVRVAKEKENSAKAEREAALKSQMDDMRGMFSDVS